MEVVHPICCGIDVHKKMLSVCLRTALGGTQVQKQAREFRTTTSGLRELLTWLEQHQCPVVAMESTGVYWKPVYTVLSPSVEVIVGNAREIRQRPGKKTDKTDADWISELLAHGLIAASFVPPPQIQALRNLTRMRVTLVQARTRAKNAVHKNLETANIKLGSVASDIFGVSGRDMLDALSAGERDSKRLAVLARGRMRSKIPELELALEGSFTEQHGMLIRMCLQQIDLFDQQIAEVDQELNKMYEKLREPVERLESIPGIKRTAALAIVGEIGADMSRFQSSKRLCSWAGMCPGNNESAGKRKSGKTRKGNKWLRRILTQCAWTVCRSNNGPGQRFRALQTRIGGKKTAVAIGHDMLTIAYRLFDKGTYYDEERYHRHNQRREERWLKHATARLKRLGFEVNPMPETA